MEYRPPFQERINEIKQKVKLLHEVMSESNHVMVPADLLATKSMCDSVCQLKTNETHHRIENNLQKMEKACREVQKITNSLKEKGTDNEIIKSQVQKIETLQDELVKKDETIKQLQKKIEALTNDNKGLRVKIANLQQKLLTKEEDILQLKRKLKKTGDAKNDLAQLDSKKNYVIDSLNELRSKFHREMETFAVRISEGFMKLTEKEARLKAQLKELQSKRIDGHRQKQENLLWLANIHIITESGNNQNEFEEYFYKSLTKFIKFNHTFTNSEIISTLDQKAWLLDNVAYLLGREKNIKTHLLFKYDPLNTTSFHKYVDQRENILLVMKAVNGLIIGGYSSTPIVKGRADKHSAAMLFELTREKVYLTKKEVKYPVVPFDDFYIIFGNSEIRIKVPENKLFSNFGVNTGIFDSKGEKAADFLGQQGSDIEVLSLQFYQISAD